MTPVDYLVAHDGPPDRSGVAYDYVLAGDGLYVATENAHLSVRVPVASVDVRGLAPIGAACTLRHSLLPIAIWDAIARLARAATANGTEILCAVTYEDGDYHLRLPRQAVSAASVAFRRTEDVVLEVHSHGRAAAYFSPTDTADEQRLRLYGVIGHADAPRPDVCLRVGAYGYYLPLAWADVFDGDPRVVRDVAFGEPAEPLIAWDLDAEFETRIAPEEPDDL
jgi:PRTRC genetic system protein A